MNEQPWKNYYPEELNSMSTLIANVMIADSILDKEDWPIDTIIITSGVVTKQMPVCYSNVYQIPNMEGWDMRMLEIWLNSNQEQILDPDGSENNIAIMEGF